MSGDEVMWRAFVEREGGDPDHEVRTATFLVTALVRKFPPSLRAKILANVAELIEQPATQLETAVANAGDPDVADRFRKRVQRIVTKGAT